MADTTQQQLDQYGNTITDRQAKIKALGYTGAFDQSGAANKWLMDTYGTTDYRNLQPQALDQYGNTTTNRQAQIKALGYNGVFDQSGAANKWLMDTYGTTDYRSLQPKTLAQTLASNVNNPSLATGATMVPQTMQVQNGEQQAFTPIASPGQATYGGNVSVAPTTTTQVNPLTGQTSAAVPLSYIQNVDGTYTPVLAGNSVPQSEAIQGQVNPLATVQGQLAKLYSETGDVTQTPWAKGAVNPVNEQMAARGLTNSSIAMGAMTSAIQQSAINIAATDAATFFQMDITNLNNAQQTAWNNTQLRMQGLLSDTAAQNAALQFNASNETQIAEFQSQMVSSIQEANAARAVAQEQFNAAAKNQAGLQEQQLTTQADISNKQRAEAVDQFNKTMKYQIDTFNATMATQIDQSNVTWRRQINTANTAAINAANQTNVQNAFNLSNYSLNALWQQARDEASWIWQSSESNADRAARLAEITLQGSISSNQMSAKNKADIYQALGSAAFNLLGKL